MGRSALFWRAKIKITRAWSTEITSSETCPLLRGWHHQKALMVGTFTDAPEVLGIHQQP